MARHVRFGALSYVTLHWTVLSWRSYTIYLGEGRLLQQCQVSLLVYELIDTLNSVRGVDLRLSISTHALKVTDPLTKTALLV